MKLTNLSVFFPAYNEEKNIKSTVEKAVKVVTGLKAKKIIKNWEVIVVDDGSKDKTKEVAEKLASQINGVKVISQPNGGYGMALRTGFKTAKYDWVVYNDSDGQFDFAQIDRFLPLTDQADMIYGYRIKRNDPFIRLLNAKGWALALLLFFGLSLKDVDVGFKMVNQNVLKKIVKDLQSTRGGMINAELAIRAKQAGFKIAQVGVDHFPRKFGSPTGAKLNVIIQSFIDLFKLRLTI